MKNRWPALGWVCALVTLMAVADYGVYRYFFRGSTQHETTDNHVTDEDMNHPEVPSDVAVFNGPNSRLESAFPQTSILGEDETAPEVMSRLAATDVLPDLEVVDWVIGSKFDVQELDGRILVLDIWSNW